MRLAAPVAAAAPGARSGPARLSIVSNAALVALKLIAGIVTGSVAIVTEAVHSMIDLIASVVTYFSVRAAEEPADEQHRYGHEKYENAGAAVEGLLILVGSAVIVVESVRHLIQGTEIVSLGFGIAVLALSVVVNVVVSTYLSRRAKATESPALAGDAAHLRTDAATSAGVLGGLLLVAITDATWIDPAIALTIATVIVVAGVRITRRAWAVLVDEALPEHEVQAVRDEVADFAGRGVVGYHKLRTRRAGTQRYVDLHVQFAPGTSLEGAHATAHALQDRICRRLRNVDVLIHLEPADKVRVEGDSEPLGVAQRRLIAAASPTPSHTPA